MVAARGERGAIGKDGRLPWHYPIDLVHFQRLAEGVPCIYGRKTYESIPHSPPHDGLAIVLTNSGVESQSHPTLIECGSVPECLELINALPVPKVRICGGQLVYEEFMPYADVLRITEIPEVVDDATAHFPEIPDNWEKKSGQTYNSLEFNTFYSR